MTQAFRTKARIQYSSQDELDVAVIDYCRGRSRHDLHARTRSALNGFYGPFAMESVEAPAEDIRRQAMRSVRQLTSQILEIKEQFLPELLTLEVLANGQLGSGAMPAATVYSADRASQKNGFAARPPVNDSDSFRKAEPGRVELTSNSPSRPTSDSGPIDEPLREFLGEDAAIMAGLNPFINDLT
ncbi:MAG: hypothetical protein F6J95_020090 [Leptolyngbya sp. SIO1E4]|nr:hypothetical protein [Leptolyngbya sp. SIO1E4]